MDSPTVVLTPTEAFLLESALLHPATQAHLICLAPTWRLPANFILMLVHELADEIAQKHEIQAQDPLEQYLVWAALSHGIAPNQTPKPLAPRFYHWVLDTLAQRLQYAFRIDLHAGGETPYMFL